MPKPGKQHAQKRERHARLMAVPDDTDAPTWTRPPPEECDDAPIFTFAPDGADVTTDRIKLRMVNHSHSGVLVEFAIIQQTKHAGRWRDVAAADSCHDVDAHMHRYGRRADDRIGDPETLMQILSVADVQNGYDIAYDAVVENWVENRRRWQDA